MNSWQASAPSNIALIKYMGKHETKTNVPSNSSLSLTLDKLQSWVVIVQSGNGPDHWQPLEETIAGQDFMPLHLSEKGQQRFLKNWLSLKDYFQIEGNYRLRSANNFPADCGIASSASSFAALTLAAYAVARDRGQIHQDLTTEKLAQLCRQASGSSSRSLMGPWVEWSERIRSLTSAFDPLFHYAVIVNSQTKKVSSSDAHQRVTSSLLFASRPERAELRLIKTKELLQVGSRSAWRELFEICWQEFWDMHALFETSQPAFGYLSPESLQVLNWARQEWETQGDGPLVTMDAGPNVHFMWRPEQRVRAEELKKHFEEQAFKVIIGNE